MGARGNVKEDLEMWSAYFEIRVFKKALLDVLNQLLKIKQGKMGNAVKCNAIQQIYKSIG